IDRTFVVRCHCKHACFRHRDPRELVDWCRCAVVVHCHTIEHVCIGMSCTDCRKITLQAFKGFLHLPFCIFNTASLIVFLSHYFLINVPIVSPDTARLILPSSVIENTTSGISLSIQKDEAVASITWRFSWSISIYVSLSYL